MNARTVIYGGRPRTAEPVFIDLPPDPAPHRLQRPRIVPVFLPHAGCPHRCLFCNQRVIAGQPNAHEDPDPERIVQRWLPGRPADPQTVQLAFYGGNFLGLPPVRQRPLLDAVKRLLADGWIGSLRFSTRPDTIDRQGLAQLAQIPIAGVELGVQSMDDGVLAACGRGHTAAHTASAAALLRAAGYRVGMQMMIGLPGEDHRSAMVTGARIARLGPDFVRIYPCLVLADTPLAAVWRQGRYHPLDLDRAVVITKRLWRLFARQRIPVIRMGLQSSPALDPAHGLLAGPYHPAFGHLVRSALACDGLARELKRRPAAGCRILITVHPRQIPCVRGQRNANIQSLTERFDLADIRVKADPGLPPHRMGLRIG